MVQYLFNLLNIRSAAILRQRSKNAASIFTKVVTEYQKINAAAEAKIAEKKAEMERLAIETDELSQLAQENANVIAKINAILY